MFNVFIFGALILSRLRSKIPDEEIQSLLKVAGEHEIKERFPFKEKPYSPVKRLFFLWTLISTFHDVAIPIEKIRKVEEGFNKFLSLFGYRLKELDIEMSPSIDSQLQYYFGLIARIYSGHLTIEHGLYRRPLKPNPYVYKTLTRALDENDHGVVSALFLFRSIEEAHLRGMVRGVSLNVEEYSDYIMTVFQHDISRAALAIAFHNLSPEDFPKLFPVKFGDFPLLSLLILCDEIQEHFRPEGPNFETTTKLKSFPTLKVEKTKLAKDVQPLNIEIQHKYKCFGETSRNEIWSKWDKISKTLETKLELDPSKIRVRINVNQLLSNGKESALFGWSSYK